MPGRGVSKVEWSDRHQTWLILDGTGAVVDTRNSRLKARERSVQFAANERKLMGIMGKMRLWPQQTLADIFGVSSRTIRDQMDAMNRDR